MQTDWANIFNGVITVLSFAILVGLMWLAKLTRANGFYWKAAAFAWVVVVRALLFAHVEPFVKYSAQVTLPFYLMFGLGLLLTIHRLLMVYRSNGKARSAAAIMADQQRIEEAAKVVRMAAQLAAETVKATADTAALALAAKERALETEALAREVQEHVDRGKAE